ncbi:hypothetical protein ACIQ6R_18040 [Streptomyces sp. NPDC096048]|uniref:hypothetical protein n=1 Tax=Streptomyces sp. NPDC096048 TaxID=3366072 RepID=UPI003809D00C
MGMYHSTYFAYGVHVPVPNGVHPWAENDRVNEQLIAVKEQCPDVGWLSAGNYDADELFLTTQCDEVSLGTFKHVTPETVTAEQLADWNRQLAIAVDALAYSTLPDLGAPGWLCVPDLS